MIVNFLRRYGVVKDITDKNFIPSKIPEGCTPIHLNLVVIFFYILGLVISLTSMFGSMEECDN